MDIPNSDLALMAFLEGIEATPEIPDGCDIDAMASRGLVACRGMQCMLTQAGQAHLRHLRTMLRGEYQLNW